MKPRDRGDADRIRRCVSRRRPKLKAVGLPSTHVRHVFGFEWCRLRCLIEILTFEQWESLAPAERPADAQLIPGGIGYWVPTWDATQEEFDDANDMMSQYRATRGS